MFPAAPPPSPSSDAELLTRYQTAPDGEVFRDLASRHLPLVWSTARRLVNGDASLAEDVAQIVFADFARKAPQLPVGTVAAGWLHRHTCFTARKMVRTEVRRRTREHTAAELHAASSATASPDAMSSDSDSLWSEAAPYLDAALDQLPRADREALLLRFYQRQDHRSIGSVLGTSEEAARKRITRAMEKLRAVFKRRGVLLTVALLSQFLTDHATAAVPSQLAATLPGAAWRQANAAGPIAALVPASLLRRTAWPAVVAVLAVAAGAWALAESSWFGGDGGKVAAIAGKSKNQSLSQAVPEGPAQVFRYTVADFPAKFLGVRLLTWQPGGSDGALFTQAAGLAKSSGTLEEFDVTGPVGRELQLWQNHPWDYADGWTWDQEKDIAVAKPDRKETKAIGTLLASTAKESGSESGGLELSWQLRHHYAEPEFHGWPIALEASGGDPARIVRMEDFHEAQGAGRIDNLMENEPRLLLIQHLPAAVLPDSAPEPRTLLLFVTLNPS